MWRPDNIPPEDLATQLQEQVIFQVLVNAMQIIDFQSLIVEFLIDHQSSLLSSWRNCQLFFFSSIHKKFNAYQWEKDYLWINANDKKPTQMIGPTG